MPDASQPVPIQRVLVVTAHPDDSEFGAGGTVAKLVREGKHVSYCIVTNGNKGSSDRSMTPERIARIREEEQRAAARVLGVETIDFLGFPDCEVEDTRETRMAVTAITASWPESRSTACIPSPAITWPSPSWPRRGSSRTRSARST
jgi:LmbE family N-acetylglucosaminyl deacetylase